MMKIVSQQPSLNLTRGTLGTSEELLIIVIKHVRPDSPDIKLWDEECRLHLPKK